MDDSFDSVDIFFDRLANDIKDMKEDIKNQTNKRLARLQLQFQQPLLGKQTKTKDMKTCMRMENAVEDEKF